MVWNKSIWACLHFGSNNSVPVPAWIQSQEFGDKYSPICHDWIAKNFPCSLEASQCWEFSPKPPSGSSNLLEYHCFLQNLRRYFSEQCFLLSLRYLEWKWRIYICLGLWATSILKFCLFQGSLLERHLRNGEGLWSIFVAICQLFASLGQSLQSRTLGSYFRWPFWGIYREFLAYRTFAKKMRIVVLCYL